MRIVRSTAAARVRHLPVRRRLIEWVRRLLALAADRRGVSTVEYALIVVAIIAIVGGVAAAMSNSYNNLFTNLGVDISNVVT